MLTDAHVPFRSDGLRIDGTFFFVHVWCVHVSVSYYCFVVFFFIFACCSCATGWSPYSFLLFFFSACTSWLRKIRLGKLVSGIKSCCRYGDGIIVPFSFNRNRSSPAVGGI